MNWLQYFLAKRRVKRERKFEQLTCPHQYKKVFSTDYRDMWGDISYTEVNIYCPVCDKRDKLLSHKWNIIHNAQIARDKYTEEALSK